MISPVDRVVTVLAPHLGISMARASVSKALEDLGLSPDALEPGSLGDLADALTPQLKVFLGSARTDALADRIVHPNREADTSVVRSSGWITALVLGLVLAAGVLTFGGWYESTGTTVFYALTKTLSLFAVGFASFICSDWHEAGSRERRYWMLLGVGFLLFAGGQSVLTYYQVGYDEQIPFPSVGDPFFVACYVALTWALLSFCITARRSGAPLGTPLAFWSPALVVAVLFVASAAFILMPVIEATEAWDVMFLNLYYPVASFVILAPCLVMLRVGLKFRGGKLLRTWLPITAGFAFALVSDVMFAFLTTHDIGWIIPLMDFLYLSGYILIARGVLFQVFLMES